MSKEELDALERAANEAAAAYTAAVADAERKQTEWLQAWMAYRAALEKQVRLE